MLRTLTVWVVLSCGAAFAQGAVAAPISARKKEIAKEPKKSLFERLGGKPALDAVIDDFIGRIAKDEKINSGFAITDVPRFRQRLVEFVCYATGGPCVYSGRDMKTLHTGMHVTNEQFDAVVGHLVGTLEKFKVPAAEKNELLGLLGPTRSQIVEE